MATYGKKLLDINGNIILPKTRSSLVYMDDNSTVEDKISSILNGTTVVGKANLLSSLSDPVWVTNYFTSEELGQTVGQNDCNVTSRYCVIGKFCYVFLYVQILCSKTFSDVWYVFHINNHADARICPPAAYCEFPNISWKYCGILAPGTVSSIPFDCWINSSDENIIFILKKSFESGTVLTASGLYEIE